MNLASLSTSVSQFYCGFNGGCGLLFNCETEYLRHVIKHLLIQGTSSLEIVEGFREQSRLLTRDMYAFDCLIPRRILTAYYQLKTESASEPVEQCLDTNSFAISSSSSTSGIYHGAINRSVDSSSHLFPIFDLVLNRFLSNEDDLIPSRSSVVSMNDVVPVTIPKASFLGVDDIPENGCSPSFARPKDPEMSFQWSRVLVNYPSIVDGMTCDEIIDLAAAKSEKLDAAGKVTTTPAPASSSSSDTLRNPLNLLRPETLPLRMSCSESDYYIPNKKEIQARNVWPRPNNSSSISNNNNNKPVHWSTVAHRKASPGFLYTSQFRVSSCGSSSSNSRGPGKSSSSCWAPRTPLAPLLTTQKAAAGVNNNKSPTRSATRAGPAPSTHPGKRKRILQIAAAPTPPGILRVPQLIKKVVMNGKENKNDSDCYSSAYILEEGLKKKKASGVIYLKPYVCPVPKCGKSYKNANGIKYHAKYGHVAPRTYPCSMMSETFSCSCTSSSSSSSTASSTCSSDELSSTSSGSSDNTSSSCSSCSSSTSSSGSSDSDSLSDSEQRHLGSSSDSDEETSTICPSVL